MEEYQQTLDEFNAIDGDFYESNIRKQLKTAGLAGYEDQLLTNLSGGEFKLVQAIREMMISRNLLLWMSRCVPGFSALKCTSESDQFP